MTEQQPAESDAEAAEVLMDHAAASLRADMDTARANIGPQREPLANLADAGLITLPPRAEEPDGPTPA